MAGGQRFQGGFEIALSTEVFDPILNCWRVIEAKLPGPKYGLRMLTTFNDHVFIFGIYILWSSSWLLHI